MPTTSGIKKKSFWRPIAAPFRRLLKKLGGKTSQTPFHYDSHPAVRKKQLAERLLTKDGEIKLCWAGSGEGSNGYANLGDSLSAYIVANLSGLPVSRTPATTDETRLLAVGSIGHTARRGEAVIWGTGCYRPDKMKLHLQETRYHILGVRGETSRECLESLGIATPHCYGDPVWLLPSMFSEKVEKKFELGVVCHISDLVDSTPDALPKDEWESLQIEDSMKSAVTLINTWHTPDLQGMLGKLRSILECKRIASRSFHGNVIAEAYGIPSVPLCANAGVPQRLFHMEETTPMRVDKRALEFYLHGSRRPIAFLGQRRHPRTDWDALIRTIDRYWAPMQYDIGALLEAFPFEIPQDPFTGSVPQNPSLISQGF